MANDPDRLTTSADLLGIRMVSSDTGTLIASRSDVDDVEITLRSESKCVADADEPEIFHFFVSAVIDFIRSKVGEEAERVVWIEATFQLDYRIELDDEPALTESELGAFGDGTVMFNAWPYLREFVQSSLIRMNLPPITLPLLRRRAAPMGARGKERKRA